MISNTCTIGRWETLQQETVTKNTENPECPRHGPRAFSIHRIRSRRINGQEGLLFIINRTSTTNHGPPAYTHPGVCAAYTLIIVLAYTRTHLRPGSTHPIRYVRMLQHCVLAYTHRTHRSRIRTSPRIRTLGCVHPPAVYMHPPPRVCVNAQARRRVRIRTRSRIRTNRSRIRTYSRIRTLRTLRCVFACVHLRFLASLAVRVARTGA